MKTYLFAITILCISELLGAQSTKSVPAEPPSSADSSFVWDGPPSPAYAWSLRDRVWVVFPAHDSGELQNHWVDLGGVLGPTILRPGGIATYQIMVSPMYAEKAKYVWRLPDPKDKSVGATREPECLRHHFYDNDVEIEWKLWPSNGVQVLKPPAPLRTPIHRGLLKYSEFTIQLHSPETQYINVYFNAYREGRLVAYSVGHFAINSFPYKDGDVEGEYQKKTYGLLTPENVAIFQRQDDEENRLGPNEILAESRTIDDLKKELARKAKQ